MYCLVDVNNFFVSCERLFRPDLVTAPVLVLSSNDGCVIARSSEVKALGIPMGVPFFKIKDQVTHYKINCFSSNFPLYADMSKRFYSSIGTDFPLEIYSVDEVFLKLPDHFPFLETFAYGLRQKLLHHLGLPTSIGIAPTKTLSKLAQLCAKKDPTLNNVCLLSSSEDITHALKKTSLKDVWGVGRALLPKLTSLGLRSAYDLAITSPQWIRDHFSITLENTARELGGEACLSLDETPEPRKSLQVSRSFGRPATDLLTLHSAFSSFCEMASQKLRRSHLFAQGCVLYVRYKEKPSSPLHVFQKSFSFKRPLQDPRLIMEVLTHHLTTLFLSLKNNPSFRSLAFYKGGLTFFPLIPPSSQRSLFEDAPFSSSSRKSIFPAVDKIHKRFGPHSLHLASSLGTSWKPKGTRKSPGYTTSWDHLPVVRASSL